MTRKDYIKMTEELKGAFHSGMPTTDNDQEFDGYVNGFTQAVEALSAALDKDNSKFSEIIFINAIMGDAEYAPPTEEEDSV